MQSSESVIGYAPAFLARGSTRAPFDSSNCPSTTTLSSPVSPSEITETPCEVRIDLDRLDLGGAVLDDKHIVAVLAALHGDRGHHDGVFIADHELGRDQGPRPQRLVLVVHDAAHGHHARGGVHGVLDHRDLAALGTLVARDRRGDPGIALGHCLAQVDQHALRNGEGHVNRRHLVDHGERRGIGRPHEIADLYVGGADPACKRRTDQGVAFLDLQIVQRRLIGLDSGGQGVGLRLGVINVDLRGGALADQVGEAAEIALGTLELRLILGQRPLGLLDLGVDLAAVEREQQIAFRDLGAVLEMHRDDGGLDPRFQRHAGDWRHGPDRIDVDGDGFALGLGQFDRDHARPLRPAPWPRRPSRSSGLHRRPPRQCR